ncbi:MAG: sigma-54-dependent Fis family transcriptional regulator [Alphaproteobacteria bacterium]|nr:sigma-54-dependent Fis family transcriptional regulator [Alphaproteobacteria bacterium]
MTTASPDGRDSSDDALAPLEDLDRTLMRLLDRVCRQVGASRASLFLRDPVTHEAVTRVAHLEGRDEIRVPAGRGIVGAVLAQDRTMRWPGDAPAPDAESLASAGYVPTSVLAVPLRVDGSPVGVLELLDAPDDADTRVLAERMGQRLSHRIDASSLHVQLVPRGERTARLDYLAEGIIGASPAIQAAFQRVEQVADTEAGVLITGETGTGKELFARAIHAHSKRASGPLVKVDCGALPEEILENELFGHEKGAFTGADSAAAGRLEQAHGGTLFLDEVGELSLTSQTRLLRVLQDREVQRLGGGKPRPVDIRIVAATHRDLAAMVREGRFRADLFHRLQVVRIRLPALRERGHDDILRLVEHFTAEHARRHGRTVRRIPADTQDALLAWAWPGNVRELSHVLEAAVVLSRDGVLRRELLELESVVAVDGARTGDPFGVFADEPTMAELESRYLEWLMDHHDGQKAVVAEIAGIGRTTLWRKLKALGLD